jgi:hypothetical protein
MSGGWGRAPDFFGFPTDHGAHDTPAGWLRQQRRHGWVVAWRHERVDSPAPATPVA